MSKKFRLNEETTALLQHAETRKVFVRNSVDRPVLIKEVDLILYPSSVIVNYTKFNLCKILFKA